MKVRTVFIHDRFCRILDEIAPAIIVGHICPAAMEGATAENNNATGWYDGRITWIIAMIADFVVGFVIVHMVN